MRDVLKHPQGQSRNHHFPAIGYSTLCAVDGRRRGSWRNDDPRPPRRSLADQRLPDLRSLRDLRCRGPHLRGDLEPVFGPLRRPQRLRPGAGARRLPRRNGHRCPDRRRSVEACRTTLGLVRRGRGRLGGVRPSVSSGLRVDDRSLVRCRLPRLGLRIARRRCSVGNRRAARFAAGGRSRRDVPLHGRGSRTKGRRTTWSKCRPRLSLEHDGRGGRSSTRRLLVDRGSRPAGYGSDGGGAQRPRGGPCLVRAQFGRASRGWRADSGPGDSCGCGIAGGSPAGLHGSQACFS